MRREQAISVVAQVLGGDIVSAEMIVDRLLEEGLLVVGYGDADVDSIVVKFTDTFGTTKTSKQDRYAARRLANKYGSKSVCGIIQLLADNSSNQYVPIPNSVAQLEDKWVSILNFLRNLKQDEPLDI